MKHFATIEKLDTGILYSWSLPQACQCYSWHLG
jgi:hypothetical protein